MALREEGFWDQHYEEELKCFNEDGDEGEVWFGKKLSRQIASKILELAEAEDDVAPTLQVLDIGCGNGFLLTTLMEKVKADPNRSKFKACHCLGLDYSSNSISLSDKIVSKKGLNSEISLKQCDFLDLSQVASTTGGLRYDYVIDIGTYDAICLLASESEAKLSETQAKYMNALYSVIKAGTVFLFASCNHTRDELLQLFKIECSQRRDFAILGEIETPKLQFGGKEGSQVCCLIIKFT